MRGYRGVIFDMDGLLLDTERLTVACFAEEAEAHGIGDIVEIFPQLIGLRGTESDALLAQAIGGRVETRRFLDRCEAALARRLRAQVPVMPGAGTLMAALAARDMPMAVATSTRRARAERHLADAGLLPYLRSVTGGDDVMRGKPDPEVYHRAAATLGLAASDCVAFEDSGPGVRAAHASGATVVQVPDIVPPAPELIALGHVIAATLLEGAHAVGLLERA